MAIAVGDFYCRQSRSPHRYRGQTRRVLRVCHTPPRYRQRSSQKFRRFDRHDPRPRRVVMAVVGDGGRWRRRREGEGSWSENAPAAGAGLKASGNTGERQQGAAVQRVLIIEIIGATFRRKGCGRNFKMVREDDRRRLKDGGEAGKPGKSPSFQPKRDSLRIPPPPK